MKFDVQKLVRSAICLAVFLNVATCGLFAQSSITLGWNASTDPTVTGYKLHYGLASQSYGNVITAGMTTSVVVTNLSPGTTYYFAVGAYGTLGIEGPFSTELSYTVPVARPIDPVVALTWPVNAATFTAPATITLAATATANGHTLTKVQFYNGSTLLGQATAAPYTFTWSNVAAGSYSLIARLVYDSGTTLDSSPASVSVINPAPLITISSPTEGAAYSLSVPVNIAATVSAYGHTISKVGFYDGAVLIREQTAAPYAVTVTNLSAGPHSLGVRAYYEGGNTVTKSVSINVIAAQVPIVSIAADSGTISLPFLTLNGTILQNLLTTLLGGGQVVYNFTVRKAGDYVLSALVSAPSASENSFYLNIDAQPTDPMCIWNLPVNAGFTNAPVTWQGVSDTVPKVFNLTAGTHQLIVRGREANAQLGTISVWAAPFKLRVNLAKQVVLTGVGQAGHVYDVEASQNQRTWTRIGSVTNAADGSFQFTDPTPATYAARSYKLLIH